MGVGYFPLSLRLEDLEDFEIPGLTRISCERLTVSMPVWALITDKKPLDVEAVAPRLKIDETLMDRLQSSSRPSEKSSVYLRRLNVDKGNISWLDRSSKTEISADSIEVESVRQQGEGFLRVTVPHALLTLPISGERVPLLGQLKLEIKLLSDTLRIRNLEWRGEDLNLFGNGRYFFSDQSFVFRSYLQLQLRTFLEPDTDDFSPQGFAYGDLMLKKDNAGIVDARMNLRAAQFSLRGQVFEHLNASVNWNSKTREIQAFTVFNDGGLSGGVDVHSRPGSGVELFVRNVSSAKVAEMIDIADTVPLRGVVASAQFTVRKSQIGGSAVLERRDGPGPGFNLSGPVDFLYNSKSREARFSCKEGLSDLGGFRLTGLVSPKSPLSMKIDVSVEVNHLAAADPYSRHFIGLDLRKWRLAEAAGRFDVHVTRSNRGMETQSRFAFDQLVSSGVSLKNFSGTLHSRGSRVEGRMEIRDDRLSCDADLLKQPRETVIEFRNARGCIETIFKLLDLELDLKGLGEGDFKYSLESKRGALPVVTGEFRTGDIRLAGYPFSEVSGRLWSDSERVRLDDLRYAFLGGRGETELFIDYSGKRYHIKGTVKGIDSRRMNGELSGMGDCSFQGEGAFGVDPIRLQLLFPQMAFYPDRPFDLGLDDGLVFTDFENFRLDWNFKLIRQGIEMPLNLKLESRDGKYNGSFSGKIRNLNLLIPWKENRGELNLNVRIGTGERGQLDFQGVANFGGQRLTFPGFAHTIDDFEGFITINNGRFTLQSFQGRMGGGSMNANGYLTLSGGIVQDLNINIGGQSMLLYPMDRTKCILDTVLNLKRSGERYLLSGQMTFSDTLWERGLTEGFSFNTDADFTSSESAFLDLLSYDLQLQNRGDVTVRNSTMEAKGAMNLHLSGTFDRPFITGVLEARSGTISIGDKKFDISKAKVMFSNPFVMDPIVQLDSETFVQNYRLRFTASGAMSRLNPQLTSSPPLPIGDIWALMSQGELFERPTTTELSSRMGTAGLISGVLLEDVQKRAKALFGIDILRFEPDTERALVEGGSRVTIGTSITRNMVIVYSTNMSTSRREVLYVHYQLSPTVSLVGMRNEEGNFSLDIRFRKRY